MSIKQMKIKLLKDEANVVRKELNSSNISSRNGSSNSIQKKIKCGQCEKIVAFIVSVLLSCDFKTILLN